MTEPENAILVAGLSMVFHGRTVLKDVTLSMVESECVALTGANGSGKTTLLRCLAGEVRPNAGRVIWHGCEVPTSPKVRRLIGFVRHESQVYSHLTVRENLMFAARMCDVHKPARRVGELLERAGLQLYADCLPTRMSRGMRQRLSVARAVVHDPRIVLLDEPFSGLDQQGRDWLVELMIQLRTQGRTVCFATHDADLALRLAGRVVDLSGGERLDSVPGKKYLATQTAA